MNNQTAKSQSEKSKVPSHLSRMSESRRARLEEIQKREQLKGMLISKFKKKYGNQDERLQEYIDNEVQRFMKGPMLTEDNLKNLDERIQNEKMQQQENKEPNRDLPKEEDRKSRASRVSKLGSQRPKTANLTSKMDDLKSQKSVGSRASRISRKSEARPPVQEKKVEKRRDFRAESEITKSIPRVESSESELDEEDEWTAIQKFNALLHYEEQKQAAMREAERKRLLKQELMEQQKMKEQKKIEALKENLEYDKAQDEHLKVLDAKEREKAEQLHKKIL